MPDLPRNLHALLSPRLESLADGLAAALQATAGEDTFAFPRVAVSARGLERWLRLRLADRLGVVFGLQAPFPRDVVMEVLGHLVPDRQVDPVFGPGSLVWAIHHLLAERLTRPAYAEVARYLDGADPLRRWQLARQLARLYDDLQWQRPALIKAWERPDLAATDWRADLWQACRALWPERATFSDLFLAAGAVADTDLRPWPGAPLHFFGVTDLPAPALDLLWKVAAVVPVTFFLLSPSATYAGDLIARPFAGWPDPRLEPDSPAPDLDELAGAPDHPLVAANHRPLREFIDLLLDRDAVIHTDEAADSHFDRNPPAHLLAALQADLHALAESPPGSAAGLPVTVSVVAAPNLRREVEDLRDWILARFAEDPTLRPRDVIVLAPDLERYAPYLDAVLSDPPAGEPSLPFTLADRRPRAEFALADAFLAALELADSRLEAPAVLAWLERPPVRLAFRLEESDFARLRSWLEETGIRWGRDGAHAEALDLPVADAPTWERGLDTLVLGLAADGSGPRLLHGLQPWERLEGSAVGTLGSLLAAIGTLRAIATAAQEERPVPAWMDLFRTLLADLGQTAADHAGEGADPRPALRALDEALVTLREAPVHASRADPVPFAVAREALDEALGDRTAASGSFLTGAVTFAPLQPLRALPARLIAVLGLADGAYPRIDRPPPFSPLAQRRPGERSSRLRDRQLFLDLILCARDHLHLSYPAGEGRGGMHTPPAIVLAELLDVIGRLRAGADLRPDPPLVQATLQAFSPAAFADPASAGFSPAEAAGAAVLAAARNGATEPWPAFVTGPLPPPARLPWVLSPQQFAQAIAHPCRAFSQHRLHLHPVWEEEEVSDREAFTLNPLHRARLRVALARSADPAERETVLGAAAGRGVLPPGSAGLQARHQLLEVAADLAARARAAGSDHPAGHLDLDLDLGPIRVLGRIGGLHLTPAGPVLLGLFGGSDLQPFRLYTFAVLHQLAATAHPGLRTVVLTATDSACFIPPDKPLELLHGLAHTLAGGLCSPLPLAPGAAWEFASRTLWPAPKGRKDPRDSALATLEHEWEADAALQQAFPEGPPPADDFLELAGGLWLDLVACRDPSSALLAD